MYEGCANCGFAGDPRDTWIGVMMITRGFWGPASDYRGINLINSAFERDMDSVCELQPILPRCVAVKIMIPFWVP